MKIKKYCTIGTVPKSMPLTHIYMTGDFRGLIEVLQ